MEQDHTSGVSGDRQGDWRVINEILSAEQYEQAAELLQTAHITSEQVDDTILQQFVATTEQIALALATNQAESIWHQHAQIAIDERTRTLRQQLQAVLTTLNTLGQLEIQQTPDLSQRASGGASHKRQRSFFQRIQNLFGFGPDDGSDEQSLPISSTEPPTTLPEIDTPERQPIGDITSDVGSLPSPDIEKAEKPKEALTVDGFQDEATSLERISIDDEILAVSVEESVDETDQSPIDSVEPEDSPHIIEEIAPSFSLSPEATETSAITPEKPVSPFIIEETHTDIEEVAADPTPSAVLAQEIDSEPPIADQAQLALQSPSLVVYSLGPFQVYHDEQLIEDWASSKGKSVFKYMVINREHPISKEVLMDLFWPEADADAARNNLNVAIYGLRQTLRQVLPDFSHVLYQDDRYLLNPELLVWIDVEAFRKHFEKAQELENQENLITAIREYRAAEALYRGELLEEDRYEEWVIPQRQSLQDDYQMLLDRLSRYYFNESDYDACLFMCEKMLKVDTCAEEAHRRRMYCYSRQGQPYLALRQYHQCVEALINELDVEPSQSTIDLYEQIRQRQSI